jgi:capsular exopolysaccharide synthesis family protein
MGRIDEALRRSAAGGNVLSVAEARQRNFESAWVFEPAGAQAPAPDDPAGVDPSPVAGLTLKREVAPRSMTLPRQGTPSHTDVDAQVVVPRFSDRWLEKLVIAPTADSILIEQFRQLAGSLHQAQSENNTRVVMLTSAEPSEGKSLTTVNLGLTLSGSYRRRVLLIDADLRRPVLHDITGVPNSIGLGNVLKAADDDKLPVFAVTETLSVVPAGRADDDPMSALTSPRMQRILEQATARFDHVLIDSPPIGTLADSSLLARVIDTAILVVRAGRTSYPAVQKAVETLGRDRVFGIVLNGVDDMYASGYRRYYQAYTLANEQKG